MTNDEWKTRIKFRSNFWFAVRYCVKFDDFRERTKAFALRVIRFVASLPDFEPYRTIGRQLLHCGTSVGANYRAACRARSKADFIAKMKIVEEECDESLYWMELIAKINEARSAILAELLTEADEILCIVVASIKTARSQNN